MTDPCGGNTKGGGWQQLQPGVPYMRIEGTLTYSPLCYRDDEHGPTPARYRARVTDTAGIVALCEDCAARERASGDVLEIWSIRPTVLHDAVIQEWR